MVRFLKRLLAFFSGWRPESLPSHVADAEEIARFLFSDKLFAASGSRVKHHAFSPSRGETSVFRTIELNSADVWQLGKIAGASRRQSPRARADILTAKVRTARLDVVAAPSVHVRHANITGWPDEKERQRLMAMELAGASRLVLP
jgi:hypothetical protein